MILPLSQINGERRKGVRPEDLLPYLKIFTTPDAPSALIIGDNCELFIAAFKLIGIEIPRDLSIVSGQNVIVEDEGHETYVYDRLEDICAESARLIVEIVENKSGDEHKKIMLSPLLIPGTSTAAVSDAKKNAINIGDVSDE